MTGQPTAAEVLRQHAPIGDGWNCACGWVAGARHEDHQADRLAAAGLLVTPEQRHNIEVVERAYARGLAEGMKRSAEHDAQVAARALRDAAEDYTSPAGPLAFLTPEARTWLRACADRIERGEAT